MYGRSIQVPRLVSWFGEDGVEYRYSGVTHRALGWPDALAGLVERLEPIMGRSPDFVLLNRYRNGSDYMGWHRDDEVMAGNDILSVSLGAARRFLIEAHAGEPAHRLQLEHGSALLMDRNLRHCLPRTRRPVGERINLTFRVIR